MVSAIRIERRVAVVLQDVHVKRRTQFFEVAGTGDDFPFELGKYLAQYAFTGVYKSLLEKTPIKQVEKFSWIKDFFSQDTRDVETRMLSESSCLVRYSYEKGAQVTRSTCASSRGFWVRTLELSGASDVKATHRKCLLDGNDYCEFLYEWQ